MMGTFPLVSDFFKSTNLTFEFLFNLLQYRYHTKTDFLGTFLQFSGHGCW